MVAGLPPIETIRERLHSAFPVQPSLLEGARRRLAIAPDHAAGALERFADLRRLVVDGIAIDWEPEGEAAILLGTARLNTRQQPFGLYLRLCGERLVVRCTSPVGRVGVAEQAEELKRSARELGLRIGAVLTEEHSYDLTVEHDVALGPRTADAVRVAAVVRRVVTNADQLERRYVPGLDQPMTAFEADLRKERRVPSDS